MSYWFVFFSAFLASTLLPISSEFALLAALSQDPHYLLLWFAATVGNSLGAAVNWSLGRFLSHYREASWFPFKEHTLSRSERWFNRYGVWSLLFSWLPVVGDALTFFAGLLKVNFLLFFTLVFVGKGLRYYFFIAMFDLVKG